MLGSRCRQSLTGAGPSSFTLINDASTTNTKTVQSVFGTDTSALLTIYDSTTGAWTHVEAEVPSSSTSTLNIIRTIRNSSGTANPVTFTNTGTKTVFSGEFASDVLSFLTQCPTTGGTATAYTASYSPAPVAFAPNVTIKLKAHATNTGAATLAVNGLPAWPIRKGNGSVSLAAGDIPSGAVVTVMADVTNSRFVLIGVSVVNGAWGVQYGPSGWELTPTGILRQWTQGLSSGNTLTWTYPRAFSEMYGVHATVINAGSASYASTETPGLSSVVVWTSGAAQFVTLEAYGAA